MQVQRAVRLVAEAQQQADKVKADARREAGMSRYQGSRSSKRLSVVVANSPDIDFSQSRVACLAFATSVSRGASGYVVQLVAIDRHLWHRGIHFAASNELL